MGSEIVVVGSRFGCSDLHLKFEGLGVDQRLPVSLEGSAQSFSKYMLISEVVPRLYSYSTKGQLLPVAKEIQATVAPTELLLHESSHSGSRSRFVQLPFTSTAGPNYFVGVPA